MELVLIESTQKEIGSSDNSSFRFWKDPLNGGLFTHWNMNAKNGNVKNNRTRETVVKNDGVLFLPHCVDVILWN